MKYIIAHEVCGRGAEKMSTWKADLLGKAPPYPKTLEAGQTADQNAPIKWNAQYRTGSAGPLLPGLAA